jgi:hypothetical protein
MTPVTYSTWVQPLRLVRVGGEKEAHRATFLCPDAYVADWCQHKIGVRIGPVLAGVLGVPAEALEVEYVVEAHDGAAGALRKPSGLWA